MARVLRVIKEGFDDPVGYAFECPGCGQYHCFYVQDPGEPYRGGTQLWPIWGFVNGDLDRPTFQGSMLKRLERAGEPTMICHSFVTDGQIQFLADSTHHLANQTVDLFEIEQ